MSRGPASSRLARLLLPAAVVAALFVIRIWGITSNSLVLRDQMRDWSLVQGRFSELPLLGPATHVGGYTIGPAFYWILWGINAVFGPWFEHLPHAGGIGQALLQSLVDGVLLAAVWRRTGSAWSALAVVVLLATASFDLSFAPTIWNPVVGSTLAKLALALVLLDWHAGRAWRVATTIAIAWMAVHAYTGAIYVAVAVCAAIVLTPASRGAWREVKGRVLLIALVVLLLQVPYVWFQISTRFETQAMGAVTGSLRQVITGQAGPQVAKSVAGLMHAFQAIQAAPWQVPSLPIVLAVAALIVIVRHHRDVAVLTMTLIPPTLAVAGYALFLSGLDDYFYLSLMPSLVLLIVLALTAWPGRTLAHGAAVVVCVAALLLAPMRIVRAQSMNKMPEYGMLVRTSRALVHRNVPLRSVGAGFRMQPTGDAEYLYRLLGGAIDRSASLVAVIERDGTVHYETVAPR